MILNIYHKTIFDICGFTILEDQSVLQTILKI